MHEPQSPIDLTFITTRAKYVLTEAKTCWDTLASEQRSPKELLIGYALPFLVAGTLCSFVGVQLFGVNVVGFGARSVPFFSSLVSHIITCGLQVAGILLGAFIVSTLAPKFGGVNDPRRAHSLIIHSMTPGFVASLFQIVPWIGVLASLFGLYGAYLFYCGLEKMTEIPEEKRAPFCGTIIAAGIGVGIIIVLVSRIFVPDPFI